MWGVPRDDGFLAHENFAAATASLAATVNASANASSGATALRLALTNNDNDAVAAGTVAGVLVLWLVLCGICRCYCCIPCPCCICYIPCCCGYCLTKEDKRRHREQHDHYHRFDVRHYPGNTPKHWQTRGSSSYLPPFATHAVDMEEPLLGAPTYAQPPPFEDQPPAYHDVPSAPPLS